MTRQRDAEPAAISDAELGEAQQGFDDGGIGIWDLVSAEKAHLRAQAPIDAGATPSRGMTVIDDRGDAWRWGRTRWSCMTAVDGERIARVARLPHSALVAEYGPVREIGNGRDWKYRTIRGRRS